MSAQQNDKKVKQLARIPSNKECFICTEKVTQRKVYFTRQSHSYYSQSPVYVTPKYGTFVCVNCSGLHRNQQIRVKGISMSKFSRQEVEMLQRIGNENAKRIWLSTWKNSDFPKPRADDKKRSEEFIKKIFVDKIWYDEKIHMAIESGKDPGTPSSESSRSSEEKPSVQPPKPRTPPRQTEPTKKQGDFVSSAPKEIVKEEKPATQGDEFEGFDFLMGPTKQPQAAPVDKNVSGNAGAAVGDDDSWGFNDEIDQGQPETAPGAGHNNQPKRSNKDDILDLFNSPAAVPPHQMNPIPVQPDGPSHSWDQMAFQVQAGSKPKDWDMVKEGIRQQYLQQSMLQQQMLMMQFQGAAAGAGYPQQQYGNQAAMGFGSQVPYMQQQPPQAQHPQPQATYQQPGFRQLPQPTEAPPREEQRPPKKELRDEFGDFSISEIEKETKQPAAAPAQSADWDRIASGSSTSGLERSFSNDFDFLS